MVRVSSLTSLSKQYRSVSTLSIVSLMLLCAQPTLAQNVQVKARGTDGVYVSRSDNTTTSVSTPVTGSSGEQSNAYAYGKSDIGSVHNLTLASIDSHGTSASYTFADAEAKTGYSASDIIVTDARGAQVSGMHSASINFDLTGKLLFYNLGYPGSFGQQAMGTVTIDLTVTQGATSIGTGTLSFTGSVIGSDPTIQWSGFANGLFSAYTPTSVTGDIATIITTNSFLFDASRPLGVSAILTTNANAKSYFQAVVSQTNDFSNTFGWANSGPVFNVDSGLTVNSVQGGISNNGFTPSLVAPEPGSVLLMALPILGLCARRTYRKRQNIA